MQGIYSQILSKISKIYEGYEEEAREKSEEQRKKRSNQIDKQEKQFLEEIERNEESQGKLCKEIEKSMSEGKNQNLKDCFKMLVDCRKDLQQIIKKRTLMFKVDDIIKLLIKNTRQQVSMISKNLANASDSGFLCCGGNGQKKFKSLLAKFQVTAAQWKMMANLEPKDKIESFICPKFSPSDYIFMKKLLAESWPQPQEPKVIVQQKIKEVVKEKSSSVSSPLNIANEYFSGINRQQNISHALKVYHQEADKKNDPNACSFLGQIYEEGVFLPQNLNKAIEYYKKAIKANKSYAKYRFGMALAQGVLNPKGINKPDLQAGHKMFIEASTGNDASAEAMVELGELFQKGFFNFDQDKLFTQPIDVSKAIQYYKKARQNHLVRASNNLGVLFYNKAIGQKQKSKDEERNQNLLQAKKYLTEAEEQGFTQAFYNLGILYSKGFMGQKDEQKALKYFYQGGLKGDIESKLKFTNILMRTTSLVKEQYQDHYRIAQKWMEGILMKLQLNKKISKPKEEVDLLRAEAMFNLGLIHEFGFGVEKQPKTAFNYYLEASSLGYSSAKNKLGDCYFSGYGVRQDQEMAVGFYIEAADLGNASAMVNLGTIYLNGLSHSINKDYNKAYNYFMQAMDLENTDSLIHLSYMYKNGLGFERDMEMAKKLLEQAAKSGNSTGLYMLKEIGGATEDLEVSFPTLSGSLHSPKKIDLKQIVPLISVVK